MKLEFWFDFASTYSYLSALHITNKAGKAGVAVVWHPFLLGPIFGSQGWTTSPFNIFEAKGINMWRDMERQCIALNLPLVRPDPFPQNSLSAARVAVAGSDEPWLADFCVSVFKAQFAEGKNISEETILRQSLASVGADSEYWLEKIKTPAIKDALKLRTENAQNLDIFGAPSFIVGDELFWGNDRLDQAIEWASR